MLISCTNENISSKKSRFNVPIRSCVSYTVTFLQLWEQQRGIQQTWSYSVSQRFSRKCKVLQMITSISTQNRFCQSSTQMSEMSCFTATGAQGNAGWTSLSGFCIDWSCNTMQLVSGDAKCGNENIFLWLMLKYWCSCSLSEGLNFPMKHCTLHHCPAQRVIIIWECARTCDPCQWNSSFPLSTEKNVLFWRYL